MIKKLAQKTGIDGAIGFSVLARIIQAGGGLLTLTLIALFLSKDEQGYYYTFGSIIAIQVFFELGLSGIITQYVAYETVHLKWRSENELAGNQNHLSRLSSLLHFCIKVFSVLAVILFFVLLFSGYVFFTKYKQENTSVHWKLPWIILSLSTSLMLVMSPVLAFLEGLGKVKETAKIRFVQQSVNILTIALVFLLKGSLFALGIASFVSFLVYFGGIFFTNKKKIFQFIYKSAGESKVYYWKEIFPYQWKIALSWISGYFVFQLFNPVIFATEGSVAAGRMGMTLQALTGVSSLSMSWITTKVPLMSSLIASKDYKKLDYTFNKTILQLSGVNFSLIIAFFLVVIGLDYFNLSLSQRFLSILPLSLLCAATFANQFVFSWATYMRCHKQEPFLNLSLTSGVLSAISIILLGKFYGLTGIVGGYFFLTLFVVLPWAYFIFYTKKQAWHNG